MKLTSLIFATALLAGCTHEADVASENLSVAADQFQIQRRIVFYNTMSDTYLMSLEGLCSLGNSDHSGELSVTCKIGPGLGTYFK